MAFCYMILWRHSVPSLTPSLPRSHVAQQSKHVARKIKERVQKRKLDVNLQEQFLTGRLYACISSRPGQCGRCDGYILEGKELEFYAKKMQKKKSKAA